MTRLRTLGYGALGLPLAFVALPVYVHVPRLYADTLGMELAIIGFILLGARLLDAGIDPWLGWLADRVSRPVMLAVALLPMAAGFFALMNPPTAAGMHPVAWLLATLVVTYLGYSAASVAYQAWSVDLGSDGPQRTALTASREAWGLLGVVLAAALPTVLASDLAAGARWMAWLLLPTLLLCAALTLRVGRVARQARQMPREPLVHALRAALGDPAFRRLLAIFVANGIAAAVPATLFLFFVADVLQAERLGGLFLAVYFVAGAVGLPLWLRLAGRVGRVRAWLTALAIAQAAFIGALWLGPGDVAAYGVICLLTGLALGADLALPAAMAADLGDRQGRAGACFGWWNFVAKMNLALAAGLALPLLALLGYRPGSVDDTGGGVAALSLAYALLPLAFKAVAGVMLWRWRHRLEN